jgi:hypothetical protein
VNSHHYHDQTNSPRQIDRYKLDDFFIKMIIGGGHANEDAKLGRVLETAGIEGVLEAELDVGEDDLIAFVKIRARYVLFF